MSLPNSQHNANFDCLLIPPAAYAHSPSTKIPPISTFNSFTLSNFLQCRCGVFKTLWGPILSAWVVIKMRRTASGEVVCTLKLNNDTSGKEDKFASRWTVRWTHRWTLPEIVSVQFQWTKVKINTWENYPNISGKPQSSRKKRLLIQQKSLWWPPNLYAQTSTQPSRFSLPRSLLLQPPPLFLKHQIWSDAISSRESFRKCMFFYLVR